jgi:microcystin-dependent protein
MSTPFIAEMRIMSFNFAPKGWALCNGQLLPINQNQALFSLLGTTYGGNGQTTFGLPNLQSRNPVGMGGGFTLGQQGGEEAHTLNVGELPSHAHTPTATTTAATLSSPAGAVWANASQTNFSPTADTTMNPASVSPTGGNQPHENMSPFLVLNVCIALQGIFPSQN